MLKSFLRKRNKETSVLNTDSFDKRRFNQIYDMSKGIQQLNENTEFPMFKELLGDIWASLYKMKPELKDEEEIGQHLQPNKQLIEKLMNEESYQQYAETTRLDDMLSAVATVNFGKTTQHWIDEQRQENEELEKQMQQLQQLLEQLEKEDNKKKNDSEQDGFQESAAENAFHQAMSDLANQISQSMQENGQSFSQSIKKAVEDTKNIKKNMDTLFGGIEAGSGRGELNKMPLRQKLELAEILTYNNKMKEIAKWAGKYTKVARTKQKMKHKESTEQSGIEQGNNIERVLPSELVQFTNPLTKNDFLKRYAEGQLMQYEQKGKEALGQGSIVLCLDQSGSMDYIEMQSKGFALALMAIAKKQKRNFVYIPFSSSVGKVMQFSKGRISPKEMIKIATDFMNGGTNFMPPLRESLKTIKKDKFKDADIIFITDGNAGINSHFINEFNKIKEDKKTHLLSLIIGVNSNRSSLKDISDRIVQITDFDDEGAFEAFEI